MRTRKKIFIFVCFWLFIMNINVYAAPDTSSIDNIVKWLATWAGKIGLVVAFMGGIQISLSFKNDDADAKVRGIKTLVSGFMVFSISQALDLFKL